MNLFLKKVAAFLRRPCSSMRDNIKLAKNNHNQNNDDDYNILFLHFVYCFTIFKTSLLLSLIKYTPFVYLLKLTCCLLVVIFMLSSIRPLISYTTAMVPKMYPFM